MPSKNYYWSEITFQWSWILEMQDWGWASPASMPQVFVCCNSLLAYFSFFFACFVVFLLLRPHPKGIFLNVFLQLKILNSNYDKYTIKKFSILLIIELYHTYTYTSLLFEMWDVTLNHFVGNLFSICGSTEILLTYCCQEWSKSLANSHS